MSGVNAPALVGGAIQVAGTSTTNINNVTISGNTAGGGGAIFIQSGTVNVTNSTISGNTAVNNGGGIANQFILNVSNSTISGSTANGSTNTGGGIFNNATTNLVNSTITNNNANTAGGGIYSCCTLNMKNTIVAGNLAPNSNIKDITGSVTGYNLIGNSTGATISGTTTGNQLDINPLLGVLVNNGGPTRTHALLGGSPAIDKGSNSGSPLPTTDQRGAGFARTVNLDIANAAGGDGTDIGAFESTTIPPCGLAATPIAFGQTINGTLAPGDCHFTPAGGNVGELATLYDAYTFTATAGQQIVITKTSSDFDTTVRLYRGSFPGGTFVTENDDGGGGTNSRIPPGSGSFTIPVSGQHTILTNAFRNFGTGHIRST